MPAILIADIDVTDPAVYEDYKKANPDVVNKYSGRYLALGCETRVLEGDWDLHRTIVIEFPSMQILNEFYDSEEYSALRQIRWQSANSRLIGIETFAEPKLRP